MDQREGKMPCLVHGAESVVDTESILDYIENSFPEPTMCPPEAKEAMKVTAPVWPAFVAFCKNPNTDKGQGPHPDHEKLEENLMVALARTDEYIAKNVGPYLCGTSPCIADFKLAPRLFHMKVALRAHKKADANDEDSPAWEVPAHMKYLLGYMEQVFSLPQFSATLYPEDYIAGGWEAARGEHSEVTFVPVGAATPCSQTFNFSYYG